MTKLNFFTAEKNLKKLKNADAAEWQKYDLSPSFHNKNLKSWKELNEQNPTLARTYVQAQMLEYISKNQEKLKLTKAILHDGNKLPNINKVFNNQKPSKSAKQCTLSVKALDCLDAAEEFVKQGKKVAVLNMANQFGPGGGYRHGAGAQEEDLCRRSNLIRSLDPEFYTKDDDEDYERNGFGEFSALYSDKVTVVRQSKDKNYAFLPEKKQFVISAISSAAYNLKYSKVKPGTEGYKQGMTHKIMMQLETALQHSHKNLVLSAFGCGAFANDPVFVSKLYKDILATPRYKYAFDNVVFAIVPNPGAANDNFQPFLNALGKPNTNQPVIGLWDNIKYEWKNDYTKLATRSLLSTSIFALSALTLPLSLLLASVVSLLSGVAFFVFSYWHTPSNLSSQNIINQKDGNSKKADTDSTPNHSDYVKPLLHNKKSTEVKPVSHAILSPANKNKVKRKVGG